MSRSSGRGQVDPFAALVAVAALGVGLSLYAGVVSDTLEADDEPRTEQVLEQVHDRTAPNGVVDPRRLTDVVSRSRPHVNATLATRTRRWTAGPPRPAGADTARRRVSIRLGPARVRAGRLRVSVW
jgi:hypothetical protein